jgi:mRNA-degrading endonuclease RelE of RelBE toxin-antitoxin system
LTYRVTYTRTARRAISERLPTVVAAACVEFIGAALAENPQRVGKALRAPLDGLHSARRGEFRVIYRIDEGELVVLVVTVQHRRDVYRA